MLALVLTFCTAAHAREPVRSLIEIRQANMIAQRWDSSCGAAALATLLTYYVGDPVSEKVVAQAMLGRTDPLLVKVRGGFSLLDLKRYAVSRGLEADGYLGVSLEQLVALGPSIVPVVMHGYPHFVVFRGFVGERVLISDPAFGNRSLEVEDFQTAWQKMAFVVERRGGKSASGLGLQLQDHLRPAPDMIRSAITR